MTHQAGPNSVAAGASPNVTLPGFLCPFQYEPRLDVISFIVPAHNEEACLGRTLRAIQQSARSLGRPFELIVVDDASSDATPEIARQHHARVVTVNHRQIAATRNSGARAARGAWLFFVDADTTINPRALTPALTAMEEGAAGGGGTTWIEKNETIPLYARLLLVLLFFTPKLAGFTGGAFLFCTREAFCTTGGFNEQLYWAEEVAFALALKRQGRFFVPLIGICFWQAWESTHGVIRIWTHLLGWVAHLHRA